MAFTHGLMMLSAPPTIAEATVVIGFWLTIMVVGRALSFIERGA